MLNTGLGQALTLLKRKPLDKCKGVALPAGVWGTLGCSAVWECVSLSSGKFLAANTNKNKLIVHITP